MKVPRPADIYTRFLQFENTLSKPVDVVLRVAVSEAVELFTVSLRVLTLNHIAEIEVVPEIGVFIGRKEQDRIYKRLDEFSAP